MFVPLMHFTHSPRSPLCWKLSPDRSSSLLAFRSFSRFLCLRLNKKTKMLTVTLQQSDSEGYSAATGLKFKLLCQRASAEVPLSNMLNFFHSRGRSDPPVQRSGNFPGWDRSCFFWDVVPVACKRLNDAELCVKITNLFTNKTQSLHVTEKTTAMLISVHKHFLLEV